MAWECSALFRNGMLKHEIVIVSLQENIKIVSRQVQLRTEYELKEYYAAAAAGASVEVA